MKARTVDTKSGAQFCVLDTDPPRLLPSALVLLPLSWNIYRVIMSKDAKVQLWDCLGFLIFQSFLPFRMVWFLHLKLWRLANHRQICEIPCFPSLHFPIYGAVCRLLRLASEKKKSQEALLKGDERPVTFLLPHEQHGRSQAPR